jgi:hypothetical protein
LNCVVVLKTGRGARGALGRLPCRVGCTSRATGGDGAYSGAVEERHDGSGGAPCGSHDPKRLNDLSTLPGAHFPPDPDPLPLPELETRAAGLVDGRIVPEQQIF